MKPDQLQKWLRLMRRAAMLWYFINNPYAVDNDPDFNYYYSSTIQRSLVRLESLPHRYGRYMMSLVLSIMLVNLPRRIKGNPPSESELKTSIERVENFLRLIERHNIICFLLNGNNSSFNQENIFREVNKYYVNKNHDNLTDKLESDMVSHFKWENAIRHIHQGENFYSWDGLQFILREYEEIISGKRVDKETNINFIYPTLEHATYRTFYEDINSLFKSNRDIYSYSLGNLFISNNHHAPRDFNEHQSRINSALKKDFKIYESELELLRYSEWTREEIIDRGTKILEAILYKWSIPLPDNKDKFYIKFFGKDN